MTEDGSIDTDSYIRYQEVFAEGLSEQHAKAISELFEGHVPEGQGSETGSEKEEE